MPDEIAIGAQYLSGTAPQGRFGIGYALLQAAASRNPAAKPIADDRRSRSSSWRNRDHARRWRDRAAHRSIARTVRAATEVEREFLIRLLAGELRQGALAGVMTDAIAAAAEASRRYRCGAR